MQYQHTANSLAAQGRNGDSMLMHVTPREVAGLQSLAQRHGGSLTTNPHTGLPEANFLDDIGLGEVNKALPTLVGAGLTYFSGGAIDPMTAAAMVGGLAGLSSGSLSQGIQAGLGAYGGASLTGTLGAMGGAANANAAVQAADAGATGPLSGNAFSNAASAPDVGAGLSAAAAHPVDFLKQNAGMLGAALLPSLMSSGEQESGPAALTNKGYIRRYAKNPRTGALEQAEAVPVDDWGSRPAVSFGGVGEPVKYADGGSIMDGANLFTTLQNSGLFNKPNASGTQNTAAGQHLVYNEATKKYDTVNSAGEPVGPVTFGGVPQSTVMRDPNDTRSDSQKAYDYLMGNTGAKNPMLFYHDQGAPTAAGAGAAAPLDMATRTGGHYVFNQSSNNYDWVPDTATSTADAAGLAALAARGTPGNNGTSAASAANAGQGSALGAMAVNGLSHLGMTALGKIVNAFNPQVAMTAEQAAVTPVVDAAFTPVTAADSSTSNSIGVPAANPMSGDPASAGAAAASNGSNGLGIGGFGLGLGTGSSTGPGPGVGGGDGGASPGSAAGPGTGGAGGSGVGNARGGYIHMASGGLGSLGGYSDGGQLLKGPGDGVSDSIPATIGRGQPARLADGEFVVPARIVSELGNGSTEAGAKQLYAMLARIQAGRAKTTGKNQVATDSKAARHLPA